MTPTLAPRAAQSREKLLRAATELLVEAGPRAVTVDAVAEASGVAKSTLYRHFPSRDDLLVEVVRSNMPDIGLPVLDAGFDTALRRFMADAAAALADPEWSRIVPALMSLRITMPELAECVREDQSTKAEVLGQVLDLGIADGLLPGDIDTDDVRHLLIGPLLLAAMTGEHERLAGLADLVAERFLASCR